MSPSQLLDADTENVSLAVKAGTARAAIARDELTKRVHDALKRGRSVALVGAAGVGKTAVVNAVAGAAGPAFDSIRRMSTATFLTGTKYLGELPTRVAAFVNEAVRCRAVLHILDPLNFRTIGSASNDPSTVFDQLRPALQRGQLRLLVELTPQDRQRMSSLRGFLELFDVIEVPPLTAEVIDSIVDAEATRLGLALSPDTLAEVVALPRHFQGTGSVLGNALDLLGHVARYAEEKRLRGEAEPVDIHFVTRVFSIISGLPKFVVSSAETLSARHVRDWFEQRLIGQRDAIDAVVETIMLFKAGLNDPERTIGTFLFVGPTGVGKTELARCLAEFLFGSSQRMLRFDLSEFADFDGFKRLIGDVYRPTEPARLIDPVRAQPFQVILFDEIEKAHINVWDLLLPLLDEGRLTSAHGDTVDFRRTLIIATSNAGAAQADRNLGFGGDGGAVERRATKTREALERVFRPELLNRFQNIVVFHALSKEQLRSVARREVSKVLARDGIARAKLVVDVSDAAIDLAVERGFDPRYGARALKREVQRTIVFPLAQRLTERRMAHGSLVQVDARDGALAIRVIETQAARAHAADQKPALDPTGVPVSAETLEPRIAAVEAALKPLYKIPQLDDVKRRLGLYSKQRFRPDFWKDPVRAAVIEEELDRLSAAMVRFDTIKEQCAAVRTKLKQSRVRKSLVASAADVAELERLLALAARELPSLPTGQLDAVVRIRPVGPEGARARDQLFSMYSRWARSRHYEVDLLAEPLSPEEPVLFAVLGPFACLYLSVEAGLHRFGKDDDARTTAPVAEVQVVPYQPYGGSEAPVSVVTQRAIKQTGVYGGKVRSRIELQTHGDRPVLFALSSQRSLQEAKDLAPTVAGALAKATPSEEIIRRYDGVDTQAYRDALTGMRSGRADALTPERLQALLEARIDARRA